MALNRKWVWLKIGRDGTVNATLGTKRAYGRNGAGGTTYTNRYSVNGSEPATWVACGIDFTDSQMTQFEADMREDGGQASDYVTHTSRSHPKFQDSVLEMGLKLIVSR